MSKRLYRSQKEKMIAGVCGGLAEFFAVDVTLVRLVWALTFFFGGVGLIAYIVAAIVIPYPPDELSSAPESATGSLETNDNTKGGGRAETDSRNNGQTLFGLLLIGLGLFFLANMFFPFLSFSRLWPLILILVGIYILFGSRGR